MTGRNRRGRSIVHCLRTVIGEKAFLVVLLDWFLENSSCYRYTAPMHIPFEGRI